MVPKYRICSLTLQFWASKVWVRDFPFLKFRASSQHALCSVCLRHKYLIKGLGGHLNARRKQTQLLTRHLQSQYSDRMNYWAARATSRLRSPSVPGSSSAGGPFTVTCILDGMDQSKFNYPRGEFFRSKELNTMQRPRAHVLGCIVHGWFRLFTISNHNMPKDSTACVEILSHIVTLLRDEGMCVSRAHFHIQADSCVREVKNNIVLRWLCTMVSARYVSLH